LLRFDKPSHEFCSGNSRVVFFVALPFTNTVVLERFDQVLEFALFYDHKSRSNFGRTGC
jgi:hypothetical protein